MLFRNRLQFKVPNLTARLNGFDTMFLSYQNLQEVPRLDVRLDFADCVFLHPHAVAFLGGMLRQLIGRGARVSVDWASCRPTVLNVLRSNRFAVAFGAILGDMPASRTDRDVVPYREDRDANIDEILEYLDQNWMGRGWLNVSNAVRSAIVGTVWEIYANAFEHSHSTTGVMTAGHYYRDRKRLALTVVDFGVGIPTNVRAFTHRNDVSAGNALRWAFQRGASTKSKDLGRGLGLDLLKEFVRVNRGKLELFSENGYARVGWRDNEFVEDYTTRNVGFKGTLVHITLRCDSSWYHFAHEPVPQPSFTF